MSCYPNNRIDKMEVNQNHQNKHCTYDSVEMNGIETERLQPEVVLTPAKGRRRRPRWSQKTLTLSVIFLLSMACIALATAYIALLHQTSQDRVPEFCVSQQCMATSAFFLQNMNTSVDPCQDFFHYACGGWLGDNPIPADYTAWGLDRILWKETQEVLRQIVQEDIARDTELSAERKLKHFYRSCMNKEQIEDAKAEPLKKIIGQLQGWYGFGDWDPDSWDMLQALILLHSEYWIDPLFTFWVDVDDKNSDKNIIMVDQGGLGWLEKSFIYENATNKAITAYRQAMKTTADLLGATPQRRDQFVQDAFNFQKTLAEITIPEEDRINVYSLYNKVNISQLMEMSPAIDWLAFFTQIFPNMTSSTEIIVRAPEYMRNLSKVIRSTPPRVLNNYMVWHMAQNYVNFMSISFRNVFEKVKHIIYGTSSTTEAWRECVRLADDYLGMAFGALFVKRKFPADSKRQVEDLIHEVKLSFRNQLNKLDWMDESTKDGARQKVDAIVDMIGYPDYILNETLLDKEYELLDIREGDFFQNILSNGKFQYENAKKKLYEPVVKYRWGMTPPEINAYYTVHMNAMVFPAGLLQFPFFDPLFPRSINYGGIGAVIGHELIHGFDDYGANYDKEGNLANWWSDDSWYNFQDRAQCLVDLYSRFEIEGIKLNGVTTLGENIADIAGLLQSFRAYKRVTQRRGEELPLPGVNMTQDQLFFLAYSQNWCTARRPEAIQGLVLTDVHSPEMFRVIGPLSQMKEFADAFKCPVGSLMNPEERCQGIWW